MRLVRMTVESQLPPTILAVVTLSIFSASVLQRPTAYSPTPRPLPRLGAVSHVAGHTVQVLLHRPHVLAQHAHPIHAADDGVGNGGLQLQHAQ